VTPKRAKEVISLGNEWCNWSKHCTPEEDTFVRKVWDTMPGYTSWHDALLRISKGETS